MVALQTFIEATNNVTGKASLTLTNQQTGVSVHSGWRARCIAQFRTRQNRDVAAGFLDALKHRYGREAADAAARSIRLDRTLARGRPLRARQVTIATDRANQQVAESRRKNHALAEVYEINLRHAERKGYGYRPMIEATARTGCAGSADVAGLLRYTELARAVQDAIIADGKEGEVGCRSIERARASEICEAIVNQQLRAAYHDTRARALQKLDPRVVGSFTHRELVHALVALDIPRDVAGSGVSPDAAECLYRRFASGIDVGKIRADLLDDEAELRMFALEVVASFKEERQAALEQLDARSYVDDRTRNAFLATVSRGTVAPNLVRYLAITHDALRERLSDLANGLPPEELHRVIESVLPVIQCAWKSANIEVTADNEQSLYRETWRFLLASMPADTVVAIYDNCFADGGPARQIGEAATWYATDFRASREAGRTYEDTEGRATPIHCEDSFKLAGDYSKMLSGLEAVLLEKVDPHAGQAPNLQAVERPDDQTVAALRNLRVPFPAPDRLNCAAEDAPPSERAMAEMRSEFDWHIQTSRAMVRKGHLGAGMTKEFIDFLQANEQVHPERPKVRFRVDGVDLPDGAATSAVVDALRRFCTDSTGKVDERLLRRISQAGSPETLDCVYAGCMDPRRPDLAVLNGYPRGVYEGHSYSLWKEGDGAVRLKITERITPLFFHPVKCDTVLPDSGAQLQDGNHPPAETLNGAQSDFRTEVLVSFGGRNHLPNIDQAKISYRLTPGEPQAPYWTPSNSSPVDARSESVEAARPDSIGSATTLEGDHIYDRLDHGPPSRPQPQPSAADSFNALVAEPGSASLRSTASP